MLGNFLGTPSRTPREDLSVGSYASEVRASPRKEQSLDGRATFSCTALRTHRGDALSTGLRQLPYTLWHAACRDRRRSEGRRRGLPRCALACAHHLPGPEGHCRARRRPHGRPQPRCPRRQPARRVGGGRTRAPRWAATWALRVLTLPGVEPARYYHFGLRGPRNDPGTLSRFVELGVEREHIYTYREIRRARQAGYDAWAEELAQRILDSAAKVWIALDPDVLNLGSTPDFGAEPLGPTVDEVIELVYRVGRAAGRGKFGGVSLMAIPHQAQSLHETLIYVLLYALAGVLSSKA